MDITFWLNLCLQGLGLFFLGTVAFDAVHWFLHYCDDRGWPILSDIGHAHCAHHDFLDRNLEIQEDYTRENLVYHVVPEFLTRVVATVPFYLLLDFWAVTAVLVVHTATFLVVLANQGVDSHHVEVESLDSPGQSPFVDIDYHLLHHVYPNNYYASVLRLFDQLAGTGCQLEGRRVTVTGSSGAFGEPMVDLLREEGVETIHRLKFGEDWDYDDYSTLDEVLPETDILILAHGSKVDRAMEANCESFVRMIEKFRRKAADRAVVPEVWAVGSEIESHPHWGDEELKIYKRSKVAYSKYARGYYAADDLLYRHIVPSAFTSPMGKGLISGRTAAKVALVFIRRGFEYVPVTYTGIALLNYPKFLFGINAETPEPTSPLAPSA